MKRRGRIYASVAVVVGFLLLGASAEVLNLGHEKGVALVHPARQSISSTPALLNLPYTDVAVKTSDGLTLRGWMIPSHNRGAFVLVHGYGGNREGMLREASILAGAGYGSLLLDLRDSGESDGTVTTFGASEVLDAEAAYQYLLSQPEIDPNRIGIMGQSMGAATTIMAAAREPGFRLAVAESPYTSVDDTVSVFVRHATGLPSFPFAPLIVYFGQQEARIDMNRVRPIDDIAKISPRPILVMAAGQDDVVGTEGGPKLFAAAKEPKDYWFVPEAGHVGFYRSRPQEFTQRLLDFVRKYMP